MNTSEPSEPIEQLPALPPSPFLARLTAFVMILALTLLILAIFFIQPYKIPAPSMMNTLLPGEYVLVSKSSYGLKIPFTQQKLWSKMPQRGDVIVFTYPLDASLTFSKRCVAVAGDTLQIRQNTLFVNGRPVDEPYRRLIGPALPFSDLNPIIIPPGHLFVLGDNRNNSADSRFWGFLNTDLVKGRVVIVYFSKDAETKQVRWDRIGTWIK